MLHRARWVVLALSLVTIACGVEPTVVDAPSDPPPAFEPVTLDPPAAGGALAAELVSTPQGLRASWLEPVDGGHRLVIADLDSSGRWSEPRVVVEHPDLFANWADRPAVVASPDGSGLAHVLAKLGDSTYAYGAHLYREGADGWVEAGLLHDDASPTEHGFVSWIVEGDGLRAFWLDGRAMAEEPPGPMQLRTTRVESGVPQPSELLDERTCECCVLDASSTPEGAVVVYRDRSPDDIRDIAVVRETTDGWTEPTVLAVDGWAITGCPVNGPAIAGDGSELAVVWYTGANEMAAVKLAFSDDAGASWTEPIEVDVDGPLGRVDLVADGGDALVGWMASDGDGARIQVQRFRRDGAANEPREIASTPASRRAGVPRFARLGDRLVVLWVELEEPNRLRAVTVPLAAV